MTSQVEFAARAGGKSQCAAILERLAQTPGQWVSMMELHLVSGSMNVHSRIADLRARGAIIEQRGQWERGKCHSSYRLVRMEGNA